MVPVQNYKKFFTELIRKQMIIFGPNIAKETASSIHGLAVSETGEVSEISGSPALILDNLVKEYQKLSKPITLLNLSLLLDQYPEIKQEYNQPIPHIRLVCSLLEEDRK